MKARSLCVWACLITACLAWEQALCEQGVVLEVKGGGAAVDNWVAEATLDLAGAREAAGGSGSTRKAAVFELDERGEVGPQAESQVNPTDEPGIYTVSWRVPGTLAPDAQRRFLLRSAPSGETMKNETAISVEETADAVLVRSGDLELEHRRGIGGMIRKVTIGGTTALLGWNDKIYDGTVYYLALQSAKKLTVSGRGPLRARIETEGEYLDAGKSAPSHPKAVYRFTTYAGLPFTLVEATVTQDFAHPWRSLHFIEMQIGQAGLTHFATDKGAGQLLQKGQFHDGSRWAAAYNESVLIGTCASKNPGVWDGGGQHYGTYVRSGTAPMNETSYRWKGAILWGHGAKAVTEREIDRWSGVLASPPTVAVYFEPLAARLGQDLEEIEKREAALADLSGDAWAARHIQLTLARSKVGEARAKLAGGRFREAEAAMGACEEAMKAQAGEVTLAGSGELRAGTVLGYPYLGNARAAYVWSKEKDGAGLISIYDREKRREFLKVDYASAPLWELALQNRSGGARRANAGTRCEAEFNANEEEARIRLTWETAGVEVEARLGREDGLLRMRLRAKARGEQMGITAVTFPAIEGIQPITPGGRDDRVLETWGLGWQKPSPLVSGTTSSTEYPNGMQFSALLGDGMGLYVAEEDGEANRKGLAWNPDARAGALGFSISHPVLGWGEDKLPREYESPGDIVIGPFHGDWYDAARIYRRWALQAPWCAKGPIYEREDYPKWLLDAPYWTIADLGDESGIQREIEKHEFYGIPTTVAHTYGYYFMLHMDDRYPEHWPPKLGSEGFKAAVKGLQEKGIRIVPYIQGWVWDEDTESFRTKDAKNKGALWGPKGELTTHTSYGGGQKLTAMCPASRLWRDEMLFMVQELVGRYGVDGVYFDFLTVHTSDCYNKEHGHRICGGNYWTKAVHGLYEEARSLAKKLNPDAMITGEDVAEYCIDVQDTFLGGGKVGTDAPLFFAVYHGYANVFGGETNKNKPIYLGRWWLLGAQNGWHNTEGAMLGKPPHESWAPLGAYYRKLLQCRWAFGTPYLGYGEMLRPPKVEGELPTITEQGTYGPFTVQAVEGSAWKAPDGSVGIFFLNYDEKESHEFTWLADLAEGAGMDGTRKVKILEWKEGDGLTTVKETRGGVLRETMKIEPLGIMALKVEAAE
ncbi:MAG: DUF6259 domain-containing protein [Planctomycetota bacterium]